MTVWDGFKAFIEFSSNFYGDSEFVFSVKPETDGQKLYYNAALGQNTKRNVLGLFVVGKPAQDYLNRSGMISRNLSYRNWMGFITTRLLRLI